MLDQPGVGIKVSKKSVKLFKAVPVEAVKSSNAAKQVWDTESCSMLKYLSINGCPRSLAGDILNRSKENLYSKVQKQIILLRQLIEQVQEAIQEYEAASLDKKNEKPFSAYLRNRVQSKLIEKYLDTSTDFYRFVTD